VLRAASPNLTRGPLSTDPWACRSRRLQLIGTGKVIRPGHSRLAYWVPQENEFDPPPPPPPPQDSEANFKSLKSAFPLGECSNAASGQLASVQPFSERKRASARQGEAAKTR